MICAVDELGIGEDHTGILVLPPDTPLGVDFAEYAGLRDDVLEITVTPDRGYAVSDPRRGARARQRLPGPVHRPGADLRARRGRVRHGRRGARPERTGAGTAGRGPPRSRDPTACDRFVLREVRGFDPRARTPLWMLVRLARCGMRGVSLAVDVTNYLMLELGQPLHAFDRAKLHGPIVVRRARPGETLTTLDHVTRTLHADDILITDDSGPISMAGTMGGLATEIDDDSTDIVIEGAHFSDTGTAKMSRRHRLHSEASYRFERGTDRELPPRATARAAALLASLGGATIVPGRDARAGAGHAGDDQHGGRLPGPGGRRRLRHGHGRRPPAGGGLRGALHAGQPGADDRALARGSGAARRRRRTGHATEPRPRAGTTASSWCCSSRRRPGGPT